MNEKPSHDTGQKVNKIPLRIHLVCFMSMTSITGPYHDVDQLLEPSKRNDKSLNQVNDLNKNCTLKRHSDINNSATNSCIDLDNNSQVHPKTPTDLPDRFSSSAHVQPNLGISVTRGFKIASINLASLY